MASPQPPAPAARTRRGILVTDAWAGLAGSVRYQKGRRDDWLTAAVTALYWDRSNKTAWAEVIDLACAAPHIPTLLDLFRRVPAAARPPVLTVAGHLTTRGASWSS